MLLQSKCLPALICFKKKRKIKIKVKQIKFLFLFDPSEK